jgi:DNA-binding MurR/RpiR family transcriptional regulator
MHKHHEEIVHLVITQLGQNIQSDLSLVEEEILQLLADAALLPHLTLEKIATKAKTSTATVSRFGGKLGFSGYRELRVAIHSMYVNIEKSIFVASDDSQHRLKNEFKKKSFSVNNNLQKFIDELDFVALEDLLASIKKSNSIMILATGFSAPAAHYLMYHLQQLGKQVIFIDSYIPGESFKQLLNHYQMCITISKSAKASGIELRMQEIVEAKCHNILITAHPSGFLCKYASSVITIHDYTQQITSHLHSFFHLKIIFFCDVLISLL